MKKKTKISFYKDYFVKLVLNILTNSYNYFQRVALKNKSFSIISNNCWGGSIYEDLKLEYLTPTVGLFFFPKDYIELVTNLKYYLNQELRFINKSKYEKGNYLIKKYGYPIGILGDNIEIHFMHYRNKMEAIEKWNRRKDRINYENIFLSFTDSEKCEIEDIKKFDELPYPKVFLSSKKIPNIKSLVWLRKYRNEPLLGNIYDERWAYRTRFNVVKWLNKNRK